MRIRRLLAPLVLALGAAALTAGPAAAVITPDPDIRSYPGGLVCSGDTVSGVVRIASLTTVQHPATVELRYNAGGKAYSQNIGTKSLTVTKGVRDYAFSFDASALPSTATQMLAYTVTGSPSAPSDTLNSRVLLVSACAPAEVVPEAPSALLVPLTLAATAGAVTVAVRRRQGSAMTPA